MKKLIAAIVVVVGVIVAWLAFHHRESRSATATTTAERRTSAQHPSERATAAVPASLAGRVTKQAGGGGIAGAVVALTEGGLSNEITPGHPPIIVVADATGAWVAPKVPPGGYVITATAVGFLPGQTTKTWVASGEQKTGVVIALAAGGTLVHGTVTDIGGGPVQDAKISLHLADRFDWDRSDFVAMTGRDGKYELSLPDGNYNAAAKHDDYTEKDADFEVRGKPVTQDFVLTPGASVRGVVIARDTGKPVPFALVHAGAQHGRFDNGGMPNATTDAEGNFTVKSLGAGVIAISAFARGYATVAPVTVEVGIGEQVDNVRVVVDRAFTISGTTVKKGTKTGVAGVHLGVFSMQGGQVVGPDPSDDQGRWEIYGVKPGSFMIFAFGEAAVPNIGKQVQVVDKDVSGVEIELETGVTIAGRVNPPQEATISVELAGEVGLTNLFEAVKTLMVHGTSDAQSGAFTLHNVPAGALKLVARATAGPTGKLPIIVTEVDQRDVVVELEVRAAIAGKVVDTAGAPVVGASVAAQRTDEHKDSQINFGDRGNHVTSGADGGFKIVGLEAGTYQLSARGESDGFDDEILTPEKKKQREKSAITIANGDTKTGVVLTVPAHDGVIRGVVVGADRQPVADSWVTAKHIPDKAPVEKGKEHDSDNEWRDDSTYWSASEPVLTGADGKFTISKLRAGDYLVVADGPRGSSRAEKKAKPGDSITIELAPLGTLTGKVTMNGNPVVGYTITCKGPAGEADRSSMAADGAYSLEHLAPGAYSCTAQSEAGTGTGKIDVSASATTLDIPLAPFASLTGTVVSMFDKTPVAGVFVIAGRDGDQSAMMDILAGTAPKTDASGRFTIKKVQPGAGAAMVMADQGFQPLATKPYTATAGVTDIGALEIVPPRKGDAGTFGMVTTWENDVLTITQVKPGGPAAAQGLAPGDVIASLSGRPIKDLGGAQVQQYLSSGSIGVGTLVQLGIERAGQKLNVAITSVKW